MLLSIIVAAVAAAVIVDVAVFVVCCLGAPRVLCFFLPCLRLQL